ncbi:hypothetical protein QQB90_004337 [Salmonella enterica]|jgi:hypothetical protein|nr:hypothetical protein [Salmonella enterica subsp. enterica serovar Enteritidis]EEW1262407.1 hypothetical protein [Escherichia coli]EGS0965745.1 hypothetical protein [Salmonella enterica]EHA8170808.1 hypothetical protein [Salmonella enterica subsp. enterica serovar Infantis]SRV24446.1 Uncharacterised protein [Shigella sonnei]HBI5688792.1 hypothetical protein [Salmonella enterica subsp. enterica serovar Welikade]
MFFTAKNYQAAGEGRDIRSKKQLLHCKAGFEFRQKKPAITDGQLFLHIINDQS